MTRLILMLAAAALFLPSHAVRAAAPAERPAADGKHEAGKRRAVERVRRLILRTLDDLLVGRKHAEEDIRELEQRKDAATTLESPRREEDFQALLDWHRRYLEWLRERYDELERELARLDAISRAGGEPLAKSFGTMTAEEKELTRKLGEEVKSYGTEEKRLSGIYDRRRVLQGRIFNLDSQLARIGKKLADKELPISEKKKNAEERERLRVESGLAKTEFHSLPAADEDILRHYGEMVERRRWTRDQLALKAEEYGALHAVIAALSSTPGDAAAIAKAYRRAIRTYDAEIGRLGKMNDELDRKLSKVPPAETLRQAGYSAELADFHQRLRERFGERIKQLKALIGAYEADLAEL